MRGESQADIAHIMKRKHNEALQLSGDRSAEEEEALKDAADKIAADGISSGQLSPSITLNGSRSLISMCTRATEPWTLSVVTSES